MCACVCVCVCVWEVEPPVGWCCSSSCGSVRPDMVGAQAAAVVTWRRERLGGPGTRLGGPGTRQRGPGSEPGPDVAPGSERRRRKDQVTEVPGRQQAQVR